ncbi:MAG: Hpt domain-containing protein [Lachnospiraceae bacterium]
MDTQKLREAGINYSEGLRRFGNKADFYEKYLAKFSDDPTYNQLKEAIEQKDYDMAFKQAHTLKGTVGNLSLEVLFQNLYPLVEALRGNETEGIEDMFAKVTAAYFKVLEAIK